ncbi:MAG TPA: hypothetical protein PKK33_11125, partial [Candidatus Cloacimonadota bacterium]|nr:hypothetical protein [Candidatus Cloacimonadota bacterium]
MNQITKDEVESLMVYIASFFLLHQKRFEHGFVFGTKFYIVRFNAEMSNIVVKGLVDKDRFSFIKEFGRYSLSELLKMYKPEHGYFVFSVNEKLFMTTVFNDRFKVKRINK